MSRTLTLALLLLALITSTPAGARATGLDVDALRANIMARSGLAGDAGRVVVEKIVPVGGKEPAKFYAVRVALLPPDGQVAPPLVRPVLVDASGTFAVEGLVNMATGAPAAEDEFREVLRYDLPAGFGRTVWTGKPGGKTIVLVSDPFCPYCRQLFNYLATRKARISELRMVHRPTGMAASLASCMILDYALDHAAETGVKPWDVASFIYGGLPETLAKGMQAPLQVLDAIMLKFPGLTVLGTPEQAVDKLNEAYGVAMKNTVESTYPYGITTVPYVFIDGVLLQGFNKNLLNMLLEK